MNSLNANVMKPVLKEIVFVGKAIAGIESEIINHYPERIIRKTNAALVRDTVVFTVNMKLVEIVVAPALYDLDNEVKRGQRRISRYSYPTPDHRTDTTNSDFDDIDLHSW